ncbi:MAG: DsbA family protein [Candidatus Altimarinota bacterium]
MKTFVSLVVALMISLTLTACDTPAPDQSAKPDVQNPSAPQGKVSVAGLWSEDDPVVGDASAPLAIVVYSDFQCPFCGEFLDTLERLKADWIDTGKVKIQYRDFPLSIHFNSVPAHLAANAAAKQGKYMEMHHLLFAKQQEWEAATNPKKFFSDYARELGLDVDQFETDSADQSLMTEIQGDKEDGRIAGVSGTPGFYVNGMYYDGALSYESMVKVLTQAEEAL